MFDPVIRPYFQSMSHVLWCLYTFILCQPYDSYSGATWLEGLQASR